MKLAVIASHPIQYHAPLFRLLAREIDLHVFFAGIPDAAKQGEGFGKAFTWDVPLLDGYAHSVFGEGLEKISDFPGIRRAAGRLKSQLGSFSPEAIWLTGWHNAGMIAGTIAALLSRLPLLFRGETNLLRPRAGWKLALHRLLLGRFAKFLYIGEENRKYYERLGFWGERLVFCPYFSDGARIAAQAESLAAGRQEIRAGWGISSGDTCFLFCGKLESKKRPLDFAEAISAVPGAVGLVVGSGELEDRLRGSPHAAKLRFAGFLNQNDIARGYAAADALVLPSDAGETWGLVVNEAMACGLPCIVSDRVGCRPDLVIEGVTGFSYPCGDVPALAQRMNALAEDPVSRARMGAAARERVAQIYTAENAARAVLEAARKVAEESHKE